MADIFREVDEEVRKERAQKLWQKYGTVVVAACVLVVVATGGRVAWREYTESRQQEEAGRYVAALLLAENGETGSAIASFDSLAAEASDGYAVLARFQEAALKARDGDAEGAIRTYELIAANDGFDQIYRDLATLKAAMLQLDGADPSGLSARLAPLAEDGQPWRLAARELQALLQYRNGDLEASREAFEALANDASAPNNMKARAREMLAAIRKGS